ncbi:mechanosensitive ion channel domain-containing protein [Lentisalinibacter orientalis]|uniref:mechanosensitive ion channel domain-containing protein n=1 Tax=Lentisalinibacter orientalis TaxID=2992241 RepID=UPI00386FF753
MSDLIAAFGDYVPALAATAFVAMVLALGQWLLLSRKPLGTEARLPRQLTMLLLTAAGLLLVVLLLPMSDSTRGQVLSLIGIVLTAVIALSSTTFVANAMAGLMLRMVRSFRPGDFVSVGEEFGRVTERGLFHTEIQTEERDLTTIPNLYLVTNPVTVVHYSGTMISASLSLGYDVAHSRIETLLKEAASASGLDEPFVHLRELGDFSVTYRVSGFLAEVKHLLTARSNLRRAILDTLHGAGIEIVSPTFMNQRRIGEGVPVIPPEADGGSAPQKTPVEQKPEDRIFDKAEEAGERESLRLELEEQQAAKTALEAAIKEADEEKKPAMQRELEALERRVAALTEAVDAAGGGKDDKDRKPGG